MAGRACERALVPLGSARRTAAKRTISSAPSSNEKTRTKSRLTSLIILINIQLFVLAVNSSKSSGANGKYFLGSFLAISQIKLTVADTTPTSSSPSLSLNLSIHGSSPRSSRPVPSSITPGQLLTTRHMTRTVCLRTGGREWERRERSSGARSRAREGVRRSETEERVEERWATVREEGEFEKSGVGGERRSCTCAGLGKSFTEVGRRECVPS